MAVSRVVFLSFCVALGAAAAQVARPLTARELANAAMDNIRAGDNKAILTLGTLGDQSVIPYLKLLYQKPDKSFGGDASYAQMALAKLGAREQLNEIVKELDNPDPATQADATKKLAYIGGKDAIRVLVAQLDKTEWHRVESDADKRLPSGKRPFDKVFFEPLSFYAMRALAEIAPNPPARAGAVLGNEDIPLWRKWWVDVGSKLK